MSKLAIIGDMHLGVKGGNQVFLDFQFWWLEEALKKMQAMGIDTVIQTGDMFDVRKFMHINVMSAVIHRLPELLKLYGIKDWFVYAGNHDTFLRDSNDICALDILHHLSTDDCVFQVVKDDVWRLDFGNQAMIAFVPWLNKNNQERLLKSIKPDTDYVFGHFEMMGMPMVAGGASCEHGLDVKHFSQYKRVISGHFHTVSQSLNVTMVGTPYHLNWNDTLDGNNRGFWVLDVETDELTLVKNEDHMTLFSVLEYDPEEKYDDGFFKPYEGNLVKVIVKEKPEPKHYKKFTDLLSKANLIDYKIIDQTIIEVEKVEISEEVLQLDTLTAMEAFIDGQSDEFLKDDVKKLAREIYVEVLSGVE